MRGGAACDTLTPPPHGPPSPRRCGCLPRRKALRRPTHAPPPPQTNFDRLGGEQLSLIQLIIALSRASAEQHTSHQLIDDHHGDDQLGASRASAEQRTSAGGLPRAFVAAGMASHEAVRSRLLAFGQPVPLPAVLLPPPLEGPQQGAHALIPDSLWRALLPQDVLVAKLCWLRDGLAAVARSVHTLRTAHRSREPLERPPRRMEAPPPPVPRLMEEAGEPAVLDAANVQALQKAVLRTHAGDFEGALELIRFARSRYVATLSPHESFAPRVATTFLGALSAVLEERGDALRVLEHRLAAWTVALQLDPANESDTTHEEIAAQLGAACYRCGQPDLAASLFARLLEASIARGRPPLRIALALNNLAAAAEGLGRYEAALRMYRRCHEIMRAEVDPSHPRLAVLLHNLSRVSREGVVLTLRNQLAVTRQGEPIVPVQNVTRGGRLLGDAYPVVGMSDLWAARYHFAPPPRERGKARGKARRGGKAKGGDKKASPKRGSKSPPRSPKGRRSKSKSPGR